MLDILSEYADSNADKTSFRITNDNIKICDKKLRELKKILKYIGKDEGIAETELRLSKLYSEQNLIILRDWEGYVKSLNIPDFDMKDKMQNQTEILGYVDLTTNKSEDRRKILITDIAELKDAKTEEPWGWAIFTKSIGSGKIGRFTIYNELYQKQPVKKGDIIHAKNEYKNKKGYWYLTEYEQYCCC